MIQYCHYIHTKRNKWSTLGTEKSFTGGTASTQRSESVNASIKGYVDRRTTFVQLFCRIRQEMQRRYEDKTKAIERRRFGERVGDIHQARFSPSLGFYPLSQV
jgi:hypothetical protein